MLRRRGAQGQETKGGIFTKLIERNTHDRVLKSWAGRTKRMLAHVWGTATGSETKKTGFVLVGRTGFEPVTSSVSGKDCAQVAAMAAALASGFILH
jgi:hypothetical protein